MTRASGYDDRPAASWGAEMLVRDAVPGEFDDLRSALDEIADLHGDDADCSSAVGEVRAALDRLTLVLVRRAVIKESMDGEWRPGIRGVRARGKDRQRNVSR